MRDIFKIFSIFTPKQIREFYFLFFVMLIGAVLESVGIGAILPLISLMGQSDYLGAHQGIASIASVFGIQSNIEFIIAGALVLLVLYIGKNAYIAWELRLQNKFSMRNQIVYTDKLLEIYLNKNYIFHVSNNTAVLLRNITQGGVIIFANMLRIVLMLVTEVVTALSIWLMLIIADSFTAIVVAGIMGFLIFLIIRTSRRYISKQGEIQNAASVEYLKWLNQGLGAVKETKVMRKEKFFLNEFDRSYTAYAVALNKYYYVSEVPRLIIETLVVSGLLSLIVIKMLLGNTPMEIVPLLGLLALAAFRLMPSANRIIGFYSTIKNHLPLFEELYDDLLLIKKLQLNKACNVYDEPDKKIIFNNKLEICSIDFAYPDEKKYVLKNVTFTIPKGKYIGIIGASGAGKTTLVDILLGLLIPQRGSILCDGKDVFQNLRGWQANLAYVPQDIYLIDGTVRENIALGVQREQIDNDLVEQVLHMAELHELIKSMPQGLDTFVGERGVKLSGGQRQRIGIARALYQRPQILILDEATSALDNETESSITATLLKLKGKITIIAIAHRVSTLEKCDFKVKLESGTARIIN